MPDTVSESESDHETNQPLSKKQRSESNVKNKTGSKKRTAISLQVKIDIIQEAAKGVKIVDLATRYGKNESTIRTIIKKKELIMKHTQSVSSAVKASRISNPVHDKVDKAVYSWFQTMRSQGLEISGVMIQAKAREFHAALQCSENFEASKGWLDRFLHRHGIRTLTVCGEKQQADCKASEEYVEFISKLIKDEGLVLDQIYNADEAGLIYRKSLSTTKALSDESLPAGRKIPKERLTLLACANATGNDRVKLLTIGKSKSPRCFARINRQTLGCHYMNSKKAWMTTPLFRNWFYAIFVPHVTKYLKSKKLPVKAILLVDNASVHDKIQVGDIRVEFLPPNTTSLIQPMDQGPIAALKKRYMTNFLLDIMNREDQGTAVLKVKSWNIKNAIMLVGTCWSQLSQQTLANSWKLLLKKYSHDLEIEVLEDEMASDDLGIIPTSTETDNDALDDLEAEIASWDEVNEMAGCYFVPTDQDILNHVINDTDLEPNYESDVEDADENNSNAACELGVEPTATNGTAEPDVTLPEKIPDIVLVEQLEKLIDQLQLRTWTSSDDTQAAQTILCRAKRQVYEGKLKNKQTFMSDYV